MTAANALGVLAAVAAMVAAVCWWKAATAFVPAPEREDGYTGITWDGGVSMRVGKHAAELFPTLQLQSRWNAKGSLAAAVSAVLTGLSLII